MKYYKLVVRFHRIMLPLGSIPEKYELTKYYQGMRALDTSEVSMLFYDTSKFSSHPRSYTFTGKDITEITSEEYDKADMADKLDGQL